MEIRILLHICNFIYKLEVWGPLWEWRGGEWVPLATILDGISGQIVWVLAWLLHLDLNPPSQMTKNLCMKLNIWLKGHLGSSVFESWSTDCVAKTPIAPGRK